MVEFYKTNNYILKWLYTKAENGKEAAKIVRNMPRVKHDHKDAIKEVKKIEYDEYITGLKIMESDMYFQVHNSTEQRLCNCVKKEDIYPELTEANYKKERNGQKVRYMALKENIEKAIKNRRLDVYE